MNALSKQLHTTMLKPTCDYVTSPFKLFIFYLPEVNHWINAQLYANQEKSKAIN